MLNDSQIERFHKDGFLIIPSIFTKDQVLKIRNYLINIFKSEIQFEGDSTQFRMDICTRYPELRWLLIHPPIFSTLRSLLGKDFVYLPEMSTHQSFYSSWHKDTTSQEIAGHKFQWQSNYLMVEVALYLQDNDEYGGGLDVIPGSHLYPDIRTNPAADEFWQKITPQLSMYTIPSYAGDLVLFHFRIDHKATLPTKCPVEFVPNERRKFVMFFACSANNEHALNYKHFISSRPNYHYLKSHQYPEDLLELIRKHDLILT